VPTHDLDGLSDDEIVARLVTVRGVGRWTAEMFLLFQLHRPDVWPVDDLGVRYGWARIHDMDAPPVPKALLLLGDPLRPYRSTAAWYCWRAAAPAPVVTRAKAPVKASGRRSPSRQKKA
jgi:DNA-3-methyladenine glycosylase II